MRRESVGNQQGNPSHNSIPQTNKNTQTIGDISIKFDFNGRGGAGATRTKTKTGPFVVGRTPLLHRTTVPRLWTEFANVMERSSHVSDIHSGIAGEVEEVESLGEDAIERPIGE